MTVYMVRRSGFAQHAFSTIEAVQAYMKFDLPEKIKDEIEEGLSVEILLPHAYYYIERKEVL